MAHNTLIRRSMTSLQYWKHSMWNIWRRLYCAQSTIHTTYQWDVWFYISPEIVFGEYPAMCHHIISILSAISCIRSIFIMIRSFENVIHMQMQSMLKQQHIYPRHWHVNYALRWRQCSIKLCCSLRLSKTIAKIKLFTNWFTCFTSKFYKSEIQQHTADRV